MADPRYAVDWTPLDITGGVNLLLAARRARAQEKTAEEQAKVQQQYAENAKVENDIKRESAAMARQRFDEEKATHQRQIEIENARALLPTSDLMRAARTAGSPGLANALGKPYGVTFDQGFEGPDINPGTGAQMAPPPNPTPAPAAAPVPQLPGGVDTVSGGADAPAAPAVTAPTEPPAPSGPATPLTAARKLYANFGGNRFEVPEQPETTGLGEKYDAVFKHALDVSGDPTKAFQAVLLMKEKDDAQAASTARATAGIDARQAESQRTHRDVEGQDERDRFLADQAMKRVVTGGNLRNQGLALTAGTRERSVDNAELGTFERVSKEAKTAAGSQKDIAVLKNIEKIEEELNSSSPAAQNAAVDTLAQIAQGGKASIAVMNVFQKHSLGPLETLQDKIYQATHNGQHSPEYIQSFKDAVKGLKDVATEQRTRAFNAHEEAAGRNSQFARNPKLAPFVENARSAYRQELGLPADQAPGGNPQTAKAKAWLSSPEGQKADPKLRAKVEAKIRAMEGGGG